MAKDYLSDSYNPDKNYLSLIVYDDEIMEDLEKLQYKQKEDIDKSKFNNEIVESMPFSSRSEILRIAIRVGIYA